MKPIGLLKRLRRREEGATAVEFAIVSGAFFMLMFGIIEYGMIMLTRVAIESAIVQVTRSASIGTETFGGCSDRVCAVKKLVEDKTIGLIRKESVTVTSKVITSSTTTTPPIPDICLDTIAAPYAASCSGAYIDNNGNPGYQSTDAGVVLLGGANDYVEIRVTYLWRVLFPMFEIFQTYAGSGGQKGFLVITSSAVIKNEPF